MRTITRLLIVCLTAIVLAAVAIPAVRADATPNPQPTRHEGNTATNTAVPLAPTVPAPASATSKPTATTVASVPSPTPIATAATSTRAANVTGTAPAGKAPPGRQPPPHIVTPNPLPPTHPAATPVGKPGAQSTPHPVLPYRDANFMRGINYISYSTYGDGYTKLDQIATNIAPSGANWVSIVPTCFQATNQSTTISCDAATNDNNFDGTGGYTPKDSDVVTAITNAHNAGLKVMLKPQIDVNNGYRGNIGFGTGTGSEANWTAWFNSYKTNLLAHYAPIAQTNNVEAFIIGTELVDTNTASTCDPGVSAQRGANWQALVTYLRTLYSRKDAGGHELTKITYAANWGTYDCAEVKSVNWWGSLDYIGVDAYYPLINAPGGVVDTTLSPSVADMIAGWTDDAHTADANGGTAPTTSLGAISAANGNKKVLFTEVGYQSQRGTTQQPSGIYTSPDPPAYFAEQANAFQATFLSLAGQPWLAGMFWWGAFITDPMFDPATDDNYPFYGKPAGDVLHNYYAAAAPQPTRHP